MGMGGPRQPCIQPCWSVESCKYCLAKTQEILLQKKKDLLTAYILLYEIVRIKLIPYLHLQQNSDL